MKLLSHNKLFSVMATATSALAFLVNPLVQAHTGTQSLVQCMAYSSPDTSHYSYSYLLQHPWLGLLMDEVTYGPITVSDVHLNKGSRLAIVNPGEVLEGDLHYKVDSTNQEMFHRYHLVVGLKGIGAQDCVTHTYGIWDSSGKGKFTLKAPLEPGFYEVRFFYQESPTCEESRSVWNDAIGEPSNYTTIGAILVHDPSHPEQDLTQLPYPYLLQHPWIGLLMDEVTYGPISVSDVHLNKGSRLAIVKPGEVLHGNLHYRIDTSNQEIFHRHHLVIGLKEIGAQDCVAHNWGIWDSNSGKGKFTLKAPLEPGLYEVRFFYQEAPTCEEARSVWNDEIGAPSSYATIGAILVTE